MRDIILRLSIVFGIFFGCLAALEASIYLAVVVIKIPLLVVVPVGVVMSFLVFVGQISQLRQGHRYE